jgi:hypothetical protein
MSVYQWLEHRVPAFAQIGESERMAILHFALLWSLFEAQVLDKDGSVPRIAATCNKWNERGLLKADTFGAELAYFRNRYIANGNVNYRFHYLNLTEKQDEQVRRVLAGATDNVVELALGVLTIVYRFRNNLFHGEKWEYQLQEQLDNFSHANAALMKATDVHLQL